MRWVAIALALVSGLLTVVALGAGFVAIMPARGGEPFITFVGACIALALVSAIAATGLGVVSLFRGRARGHLASSIVALVLAILALLPSGGIALVVLLLRASNEVEARATAEAEARHQRAIPPSDAARAHPTSAQSLFEEWARDHDAADAHHRGEVLELTWAVGGADWVDGATCAYLLSHGDVVCCLATGQTMPDNGVVTFIARYGGTDRRDSPPGRDQGRLVLDGCRAR